MMSDVYNWKCRDCGTSGVLKGLGATKVISFDCDHRAFVKFTVQGAELSVENSEIDELRARVAELAALEGQQGEPVQAVLLADMEGCRHASFGQGFFAKRCDVKLLHFAAGAREAQPMLEAKRDDAEPVATAEAGGDIVWIAEDYPLTDTSLYTHPPKRQPMTEAEIKACVSTKPDPTAVSIWSYTHGVRDAEKHHKIGEPK